MSLSSTNIDNIESIGKFDRQLRALGSHAVQTQHQIMSTCVLLVGLANNSAVAECAKNLALFGVRHFLISNLNRQQAGEVVIEPTLIANVVDTERQLDAVAQLKSYCSDASIRALSDDEERYLLGSTHTGVDLTDLTRVAVAICACDWSSAASIESALLGLVPTLDFYALWHDGTAALVYASPLARAAKFAPPLAVNAPVRVKRAAGTGFRRSGKPAAPAAASDDHKQKDDDDQRQQQHKENQEEPVQQESQPPRPAFRRALKTTAVAPNVASVALSPSLRDTMVLQTLGTLPQFGADAVRCSVVARAAMRESDLSIAFTRSIGFAWPVAEKSTCVNAPLSPLRSVTATLCGAYVSDDVIARLRCSTELAALANSSDPGAPTQARIAHEMRSRCLSGVALLDLASAGFVRLSFDDASLNHYN